MTNREREQRAEWCINRMDELRKSGKTVSAILEIRVLKRELRELEEELSCLQK